MRRTFHLAIAFLVLGCGGSQANPQPAPTQLQCTIDGQQEPRVIRDCSSEISYQERDLSARVEAFGIELGGESQVQFRPVKNSMMILMEQQRSMCRDWNACALSRQEYVSRSEWLTSQFTTLTQILDAADPSTMQDPAARERIIQQVLDWSARAQELQVTERVETERNRISAERVEAQSQANELGAERAGYEAQSATAQADQAGAQMRQAGAVEEQVRLQREMLERQAGAQGDIDEANRQARATQRAQLQVQIDQRQRQAEALRGFLPLVARAKTEANGVAEARRPRICSSNLKGQLERLGRGENAQVASSARRIVEQIGRLCGPFDRWQQPTPEILRELRRVPDGLERDEQMAGRTGSWNEPAAVAQRIVKAIQAARREVRGTEDGRRPFPCGARIWKQLEELRHAGNRFAGTAAERAVRHRNSVCGRIGVLPSQLEQAAETHARLLESVEGTIRSSARTQQDLADRLRVSLPPE